MCALEAILRVLEKSQIGTGLSRMKERQNKQGGINLMIAFNLG